MTSVDRIDPGRAGADDTPSSPEAAMLEFATHMTTLTRLDSQIAHVIFNVHIPQFLKASPQTTGELDALIDGAQRRVGTELTTMRSIVQKEIDRLVVMGSIERANQMQADLNASTAFAGNIFRQMGEAKLRLLQTAGV